MELQQQERPSSLSHFTSWTQSSARNVSQFEKVKKVGEGTYGTVYKARDKSNGQYCALKKVKISPSQLFPVTSMREIALLQQLQPHQNVIQLREVLVGAKKDSVFLSFEYCETDLANLVDKLQQPKEYFNLAEVKCLMLQLMNAVCYLHDNDVIHRDLKLSNLLLNKQGELKLADFGLARSLPYPLQPLTAKVVTLWYRSPEILLKCPYYSKPCDAWAVGCILGELLNNGFPILPGKNEVDQFRLICDLIGRPTERVWPDFKGAGALEELSSNYQNRISERFYGFSKNCIDLMKGLLEWDPKRRITLNEAIMHPFFAESPYPVLPIEIRQLKLLVD